MRAKHGVAGRKSRVRAGWIAAAFSLAPAVLFAQAASPAPAAAPSAVGTPAEKMAAVGFLAGEWEGEAWVQMGPDRREVVRQRESVEWRVGAKCS